VLEVVQVDADSSVLGERRQRQFGDNQSRARAFREFKYIAEGWGGAAPLQEQIPPVTRHKEQMSEIWTWLPVPFKTALTLLFRRTRLRG